MTLFVILVVLFCMWLTFGAPTNIEIGEGTVARRLKTLPHNKYIVFNDVMLKTNRGSVQIDHIVVSVYGIFVIETKNISGRISGDEKSQHWIKDNNGHQYEFFNPIIQNQGHINALCHRLNLPANKFISIIAFSSRGHLMFNKLPVPVVYIPQVPGKIQCYRNKKLSVKHANKIASQIRRIKKYKTVSNYEHIRDVQHAIAHNHRH
jgi:hypothetical protein